MIELVMLGRMALAIALCAIIGIEREFHGRPAGLRTHLLVGGGSALIMVIGASLLEASQKSGGGTLSLDVARLIAGVVTGIGFLGAGTIIRQGDWVRGLTTAASVWFVAGIGIAAGLGLYIIAAGAAAMGFIVLFVFSQVETWLPSLTRRVLVLEIPRDNKENIHRHLRRLCSEQHVRTRLLSWELDADKGSATIRLLLSYWRSVNVIGLANKLQEETEATSVQLEQ
jgi:putative Mg2+ transporter-C (MgtC) family protein